MREHMLRLLADDGVTHIVLDDTPESLCVTFYFDREGKSYVGALEFFGTARKAPGLMAVSIRSHLGTHMEEVE